MSDKNLERLNLVRNLITHASPLDLVISRLAQFEWDYDDDCIELNRGHLSSTLQAYLDQKLSREAVEAWANTIEGREDIEFEGRHAEEIERVLFELANPLLTQPLDRNRAAELIDELT